MAFYIRQKTKNKEQRSTIYIIGEVCEIEESVQPAILQNNNVVAVKVKRKSDNYDYIICESQELIPFMLGDKVFIRGSIKGKFRDEGKLYLRVMIREIGFAEPEAEDTNSCILSGKIKKIQDIRQTSMGKTILDFTIGAPKNLYPCISFFDGAMHIASNYAVGDDIVVEARLQSREYEKEGETKTTRELVVIAVYEPDASKGFLLNSSSNPMPL